LYWNDFLNIAKDAGFGDPRLVTSRPIEITDVALQAKLGGAKFYSATYRLFCLNGLEPAPEDYNQSVIYKAELTGQSDMFVLDQHHQFARGIAASVSGNTWRMLKETRFATYFEFVGDFSTHYGAFPDLGINIPCAAVLGTTSGSSC
jgi:hypothetical protein